MVVGGTGTSVILRYLREVKSGEASGLTACSSLMSISTCGFVMIPILPCLLWHRLDAKLVMLH